VPAISAERAPPSPRPGSSPRPPRTRSPPQLSSASPSLWRLRRSPRERRLARRAPWPAELPLSAKAKTAAWRRIADPCSARLRAEKGAGELAGKSYASARDRHPARAQLHLLRPRLEALKSEWEEVEAALQSSDLPALPRERACQVHRLRGLVRLHSGEAAGARASFLEGERWGPRLCRVR
jgi:hypothetical protein